MQTKLFVDKQITGHTVEQVAKAVNVSVATIRNWVKTGYLTQSARGLITQDSLDGFMTNVAGKEKWTSMATKQLKDGHDHIIATDKVTSLMTAFSGEIIGIEYENSLSESYRNNEGIFYTPSWVVKDMMSSITIGKDSTFLDPCCGSGNFIVEAIQAGIKPENVYGFDVDVNAVFITKERLRNEFGIETANIRVGNFLHEAVTLKREHIRFDLIFTTPPWGKKIDKLDRERFALIFDCGSSLDTTALFMGAGLSLLSDGGVLGFLNQDAFFNISTFEDIRKRAISKSIVRFTDYGRVFKGLITKAQGIIIENTESKPDTLVECCVDGDIFNRSLESFRNNPKTIFNLGANEEDEEIIERLYSIKHITLKDRAKWALGIVTGNNAKYCIDTPKEGYLPIYKGADISKSGLKEANTFIVDDFSNFQQVAPLEMYHAQEKLIYKFISSDLCFYFDTQQRLILNSANMLIPHSIGTTGKQLTDLLNSQIINWLFRKLFSTHKVLRGDLELLPIHTDYFSVHQDFSESSYLEYLNITKSNNGTFRIIS